MFSKQKIYKLAPQFYRKTKPKMNEIWKKENIKALRILVRQSSWHTLPAVRVKETDDSYWRGKNTKSYGKDSLLEPFLSHPTEKRSFFSIKYSATQIKVSTSVSASAEKASI